MRPDLSCVDRRELSHDLLTTLPRAQLMNGERTVLRYLLPDRATCIGQEQLLEESTSGTKKTSRNASRIVLYGAGSCAIDDPEFANRRIVLSVDDERFFTPAFISLGVDSGILLWVTIDLTHALSLLERLNDRESDESSERRRIGCIANLMLAPGRAFGLFTLAQLEFAEGEPHPLIGAFDDRSTPFNGLELLCSSSAEEQLTAFSVIVDTELAASRESQLNFEQSILTHNFPAAAELLHLHRAEWELSARVQFAAGCLHLQFNDYRTAAEHFHQAQLLDHPAALRGEWTCQHGHTAAFRKAHPEIFAAIRRGDRLHVLTTLRAVADQFPLSGPAILSYCLRRAGVPLEGLDACARALAQDRNQSDVLSNQWRYLIDLHRDEEALATAREHLLRFPQDQSAVRNLIDSLLLCGKADEAELLVERYAIFSTNAGVTAKQFFRVYEALEAWDDLLLRYRKLLRFIPRPSSATLIAFGEVLTETSNFDESYEVFERALTLDPANGKVILGYARSLARSDKEVEAECLLSTALNDRNRIDRFDDRVFLLTLCAEIQRRTGRPERALETFNEYLDEEISAVCRKAGPFPGIELIEIYFALGRCDEARALAFRLRRIFPDDPFVLEMQQVAA